MDKSELLALADRCEAASGPNYQLDVDIAIAVGRYGMNTRVPNFTASLDAAMTLVPEGWSRRSTWCPKASYPARWSLHLPGPVPATNEDMLIQTCGKTDALALTAAALRALDSKDQSNG